MTSQRIDILTDTSGPSARRVRWLPTLSIFAVPLAVAAIWGALQEPEYRAQAKLLFEREEVSELTGQQEGVGDITSLVRDQNPLLTELEVLQSRPILEDTINELDLRDEEGALISPGTLRNGLDVGVVGAADIIEISYTSGDPEVAAQVPNTLAQFYINGYLERKNSQPREARNILENQLAVAQQRLENSENQLREFRERNNFVNANEYSTFVIDAIASLDRDILATQSRLDELGARIDTRVSSLGVNTREAQTLRSLNQDPAVAAVIANLAQAENDLAAQRKLHSENSPVVTSIQENIRSLRARLDMLTSSYGADLSANQLLLQADQQQQQSLAELNGEEVERQGLRSRLIALQSSRDNYSSRLRDLPALEQEQSRLVRNIESSRDELTSLNQLLQRLVVTERSSVSNANLIEPAETPVAPSGGGMRIYLASGILLGGLLASTYNFWQQQASSKSQGI
ncbi:MAG: GumC family protein [Synechococcus sp.]